MMLRRLRFLSLVALAAACAAPAGAPGQDATPATRAPAKHTLRVMTYNIHAGTGGLDTIAGVIRAAAPDVVGLQEVDVHFSARSGFADQARALADALGMHVRFAHIYELAPLQGGAPPREYGVALLSRYPVRAFHNHVMPRLSTVEEESEPKPRPGFLEAVLLVDGTEVRVFDTHLDYRGDPRVRQMQVAATLDILGGDDRPTLFVGDLNARPDAPELQPLLARLRDAWRGRPDPGFTFPADAPDRRIDYILHSAHFEVAAVDVLDTTASDHRPVVAELRLRIGQPPSP